MKKALSLIWSLSIIVSLSYAQGGKFQFEKTVHDFGTVKEDGGPVSYEFTFVNMGKEPVIIANVKASCGYTTPGWTMEPVLPGKKGFVKAQFDPMNRPGTFNKTLTITSNT